MKLAQTILPLVAVMWSRCGEAQQFSQIMQQQPQQQLPFQQLSHQQLPPQQLLPYMRDMAHQENAIYGLDDRPKRGWWSNRRGSRWGNKYKDNKSYGMWITGLNKAGNKRKRAEMEVPDMAGYSDYNPYKGFLDYTEVQDLSPVQQK
eukprot:TRINITY_DN16118_c0_g1_i2.p1 TRINITY_DN16118_c0_g1~~TRINITY_DN16118_c0_g1_i2.p1  ORF type:complete len:147 (-),score=30.75 TRINITY_DN16118_c0_g1_i2:176-616(-)